MKKVSIKRGRGRPATGRDPVTAIRLPENLRNAIDTWAGTQEDTPSRSEALRRMAVDFLKRKGML